MQNHNKPSFFLILQGFFIPFARSLARAQQPPPHKEAAYLLAMREEEDILLINSAEEKDQDGVDYPRRQNSEKERKGPPEGQDQAEDGIGGKGRDRGRKQGGKKIAGEAGYSGGIAKQKIHIIEEGYEIKEKGTERRGKRPYDGCEGNKDSNLYKNACTHREDRASLPSEGLQDGIGNRVVGIRDNKIIDMDIIEAVSMKKTFNHELYETLQMISM